MKHITFYPQLFLGFTFNLGALIGYAYYANSLSLEILLFYLGCVAWTVGYDTIYAMQDIKDDIATGLKSTAVKLQDHNIIKKFVFCCYIITALFWLATIYFAGYAKFSYIAILLIIIFALYIIAKVDFNIPQDCFKKYKLSTLFAVFLVIGIIADKFFLNF